MAAGNAAYTSGGQLLLSLLSSEWGKNWGYSHVRNDQFRSLTVDTDTRYCRHTTASSVAGTWTPNGR